MVRLHRFRLLVLLMPVTVSFMHGASLSMASLNLNAGETTATPLSLSSGGQAISGIQFDVEWDASLSVRLVSTAAIGQAFKSLYTSTGAQNRIRCLIVGMNQLTLSDGWLVSLLVAANAGAEPGVSQVRIVNPVAVDPGGFAVAVAPIVAYVSIFTGAVTQTLPQQGILNLASQLPSSAAPGEIMTLLGSFSAPSPAVFFDGIPAPILFSGPGQINAIVPFGLNLNFPADVEVRSQSQRIAAATIPSAATAPAIFTQSGGGTGQSAVRNQDCTINSADNPALPGSILVIYGTGFGLLSPAATDGQILSQGLTVLPVTATIGGVPAEVNYAGVSPGSIAGVYEINVRVPATAGSATYAPLTLSVGGMPTQAGVTVSVTR